MAQEIFGDLTLSSLQIKKQNSNTNFPLFNLEGNANIGSDTSVINIIGELKYKHIIDWYYLNSLTPVLHFTNVLASTASALSQLTTLTLGDNTETAIAESGINLQMDSANTDDTGIQIDCGVNAASPCKVIIGSDKGMSIEATFFTSDWSLHDCVVIGFRKIETVVNGFGNVVAAETGDALYTDFAVFGVMGSTNSLQTLTDLNDSGVPVLTDTTNLAVDSQNLKLKVEVNKSGTVSYYYKVNDVSTSSSFSTPSITASFTFDSGDIIVPFITVTNTNNDNGIYLKQLKISKLI